MDLSGHTGSEPQGPAASIDTYHANIEELTQADAVRDAGVLLGYFHIAESHRGRHGTGTIDWATLFAALVSSDYKGPPTFESFSSSIVSTDTRDDIRLAGLYTRRHRLRPAPQRVLPGPDRPGQRSALPCSLRQ